MVPPRPSYDNLYSKHTIKARFPLGEFVRANTKFSYVIGDKKVNVLANQSRS